MEVDIGNLALTMILTNETDETIDLVELGSNLAPGEVLIVGPERVPDLLSCLQDCKDTGLYRAVKAGKIAVSRMVPREQ